MDWRDILGIALLGSVATLVGLMAALIVRVCG